VLPPADDYLYTKASPSTNLGAVVGPPLGALLVGRSFGTMFLVAGVLAWCSAVVAVLVPVSGREEASDGRQGGLRQVLASRHYVLLCLAVLTVTIAFSQLTTFLPVHMLKWPYLTLNHYGRLLSLNAVINLAFQVPVLAIILRLGHVRSAAVGALFYTAGFLTVGLAGGALSLYVVAVTLISLGEILFSPSVNSLAVSESPEQGRGMYLSLFSVSYGLGTSLGAAFGGWGVGLPQSGLLWVGCALLCCLGCGLLARRRLPGAGAAMSTSRR